MRFIEHSERADLRYSKEECLGKPQVLKLNVEGLQSLLVGRPEFANLSDWESVTLAFLNHGRTKMVRFDPPIADGPWTMPLCWTPDEPTGCWQPVLLLVATKDGKRFTMRQTDPQLGEDILVLDP